MIALKVFFSISSMFFHNCISNKLCKRDLTTSDHIYRFNGLSYIICILLFAFLALNNSFSWFTVGMGVLFGIVTALSNYFKMQSLANGPMNLTLLITTSSMIIPTLSGIFFGEKFSVYKILLLAILIYFIYLSLGRGAGRSIGKKWFLYCALAFILQGSIGVLQKIHQSTVYKSEASLFLLVAFICSLIYSSLRAKNSFKELGFTKHHYLFAAICGLCVFTMNYLNLKLSGILPSQLFFPLVNGSAIVLSTAASFFIFKEKLSKRQIIGICGGIASLISICLVP